MEILDSELKENAPDKIAFVSFTKKGAYEGRDRAMEKFGHAANDLPYFRTLHSIAFTAGNFSRYDIISMKDYRALHGGDYVFILPHDERGVRDFTRPGHWINRAYSEERGTYYIDYETQTYFQNVTEVSDWYRIQTGRRNSVYDYAVSRPGFGMQWNYPARSERT